MDLFYRRWGTFSVRDHIDGQALIRDVLMYDKLVFPVPADDRERERWEEMGWKPELQERRLEILGDDLVEKINWDEDKRQQLEDTMVKRRAVSESARCDGTTNVLARTVEPDDPVQNVEVVAAYRSVPQLKEEYVLKEHQGQAKPLYLVVGNRLELPTFEDSEDGLREAVGFAKKQDFVDQRRALFDWQKQLLNLPEDVPLKDALDDLEKRIKAYEEFMAEVEGDKSTHKAATVLRLVGTTIAATIAANLMGLEYRFVKTLADTLMVFTDFGPKNEAWKGVPADAAPAAMFYHTKKEFFDEH